MKKTFNEKTTDNELCAFNIVHQMMDVTSSYIIYKSSSTVKKITYAQAYKDAEALLKAFQNLGGKKGSVIAIHGDNSYVWLLSDLACVLGGMISLALYPSAPKERIANIIKSMDIPILLTDFPEDFTKTDFTCKIISLNDRKRENCLSVEKLIDSYKNQATKINFEANDPFTIVSTSGTLSKPKFFAVNSYPLLYTAKQFSKIYHFSQSDSLLLALPQAHLPQRMLTYGSLMNKMDLIISRPNRFVSDSLKYNPTIHVLVPRILQHINERVEKSLNGNIKGKLVLLLASLGLFKKKFYKIICSKIFGQKARCIFIGSAPTPRSILQKFWGYGCHIYEVYGTTEMGIIAVNTLDECRLGSVGKPVDWGKIKIDHDSEEILYRTDLPFLSSNIMEGKLAQAYNFAKEFTNTGDMGFIDRDGFLFLKGRVKDFIVLPSGEKIFVRPIEEKICKILGVENSILIGNGKKEIYAIIFLSNENAGKTNIKDELRKLNTSLHPWEKIKKFTLVKENPSVENGCLTETFKLRRQAIFQKYYQNKNHDFINV